MVMGKHGFVCFILRGIVGHRGSCVFRFGYFGAWVFVGVFLGGAAVGGCLVALLWVAVVVGGCR